MIILVAFEHRRAVQYVITYYKNKRGNSDDYGATGTGETAAEVIIYRGRPCRRGRHRPFQSSHTGERRLFSLMSRSSTTICVCVCVCTYAHICTDGWRQTENLLVRIVYTRTVAPCTTPASCRHHHFKRRWHHCFRLNAMVASTMTKRTRARTHTYIHTHTACRIVVMYINGTRLSWNLLLSIITPPPTVTLLL